MSETSVYTVTISGLERDEGHAPFVWVVTESEPENAIGKALGIHAQIMEESAHSLVVESWHVGMPVDGFWNDYRAA
ncbi:hypothetical protein ACTMTF_15210 [Nonomuraea sp. ZG12]|uniref:hypothetical protein n=1 Tax=Nonomuraea sp. ZG12 TaxID=3452207 RepID=UPI003F8B2495